MYKVIIDFTEPQDGRHVYRVGDDFPRDGYSPGAARVRYLLSNRTSFRAPVIEETFIIIEDEPIEEKPERKRRGKETEEGAAE